MVSMTRPLYRVTCTPWDHGLVVHIDGVGVTQTHEDYPDTVEEMARSYISLKLDVEPDSFDLAITSPETTAAIQAGIAQAERGETVDLGDFRQYLDEADYQRLADSRGTEDEQYRQAMRARKRGRPED